jgi:hypothetical protein
VIAVIPLLPHRLQRPWTRGDRAEPLDGPGTCLRVLLRALKSRAPSVTAAASTSVAAGTAMSSGGPSPPAPTPTMATKARVRVRGRGKARATAPATPATTAEAPRLDPPSTIPRPTPSRCGQGCVLRNSRWRVHHSTPYLLHRCTTRLPVAPPSCPCRRLHRTSSRPRPLPGRPGWARGINSH